MNNNDRNSHLAHAMEYILDDSQLILNRFADDFPQMFRECHGIVLLNSSQIGLLISQTIGSGVFVKHNRLKNAWGPPVAIELVGVSAGIFAGFEQKDICIFLSREDSETMLKKNFTLNLAPQVTLTVGKDTSTKRDLSAFVGPGGITKTVSFVRKQGGAAGVSLQGGVLRVRTLINSNFYRQEIKTVVAGEDIPLPPSKTLLAFLSRLHGLVQEDHDDGTIASELTQ